MINDDEMTGEEADKVEAYWCDENHLHIVLSDDGDNDIAGIALDLEEGVEFIQDLLGQLQEMTGLVFLLADPKDLELEEDTIGETVGNA